MRMTVLSAVALLGVLCAVRGDGEVQKQKVGGETDRIQRLLTDRVIETKALQKAMPLPEFLATLEGLLPKGSKLSLRIDAEAFGKDLDKVKERKIATFRSQGKMSLGAVLHRALRPVDGAVPLDYAIRDNAVVITRPRRTAYTATYPVRDIIRRMPRFLEPIARGLAGGNEDDDLYDGIAASDGTGLLVRLLINIVDFEPWETIAIRNQSRLVVSASPDRQAQVAYWLERFRLGNRVRVVMNARLYEMDRAAFAEHVAPHFAKHKVGDEAPKLLQVDDSLLALLTKQRLIAESDDERLPTDRESVFLAQQTVYRFDVGNVVGVRKRTGTGLAGVSFLVRPSISADRRFLTLRIAQRVTQLVRIEKGAKLDAATGKEIAVESPNLRRTTLRGGVQMPDGDAIVMPVDYRPALPAGEDKVWVLVARPIIWIEEEEKELRRLGHEPASRTIWKSEVPKGERSAKPVRIP